MRTRTHWLPPLGASLVLTLAVSFLGVIVPSASAQQETPNRERIGVYDSRAVAIAYVGSAFQSNTMAGLKTRFQKARETGATHETARLEAEGRAWQAKLHRQGFGTAPVDDLLVHIAGEIPGIQKTAGVTSLHSKWDKRALNQHPNAERVDVTMELVDAFHPNETQRQRAVEIQKKKPVAVKE